MIVSDTSAIIAYFQSEKGYDLVRSYIGGIIIFNSVNLIETILKMNSYQLKTDNILSQIRDMSLTITPCDNTIALIATEITHPKNMFLSLGDRICLATAISKKCPVVTADSSWKKLKLPVEIISIR